MPVSTVPKPARQGDYNPVADPVTVLARQKTRQVRRLETYLRNATTHLQRGSPPHGQHSLSRQWAAILRANGYPPSFAHWVLQIAHFSVFYLVDPPLEWVRDLATFARFDCDAELHRQARHRLALFKLRTQQDEVSGSAIGFQQLKKRSHPPIQALPVREEQPLSKAHDTSPHSAAYHCSCPQAYHCAQARLATGETVTVCGVLPDPCCAGDFVLEVRFQSEVPEQCTLVQDTTAATPELLCRQFTAHWFPVWNRETKQASQEVFQWPRFLSQIVDEPHEELHLDFGSLELWEQSLKTLQAQRATGQCGCSVAELKEMPRAVLADLVQLYQQVLQIGSFPKHMCRSTACCIPKNEAPQSMAECRPITVFSTLYRFFASTITKSILQKWSEWFPKNVFGAMPGKSARDAALDVELHVERGLLNAATVLGFSVDLSRFFNAIPRAPMLYLLAHLGVPLQFVTVWTNFLASADRYPSIQGHLGAAVPSTTGAPEGDPCSILGQAAICWAMVTQMSYAHLHVTTYIDNWAWVAGTRHAFAMALHTVQHFCDALCLTISWAKSFAWALKASDRAWVRNFVAQLLPAGHSLALVDTSKDLGVAFRFRSRLGAGLTEARVQEGKERLARLEALPRTLPNKMLLLGQSVWPATFYGTESYFFPQAILDRLRTAAARALLGRKASMSSLLVLSVLTEAILDPEPYVLQLALRGLMRLLRVDPSMGRQWLSATCEAQNAEPMPVGPATAARADYAAVTGILSRMAH